MAPPSSAGFWQGFAAIVPLWAGAIPIGIAYGVAARSAGLSPVEAQLMSVVVFSAAAQVSATALLAAGAPAPLLVLTAVALNAQLLLVGLAAGREVGLSWRRRLLLACFLTDGAYGVTVARGPLTALGLLGAGVSMFTAWNTGTALGLLAGAAVPDPRGWGLDVVVPLTFLAVLVPLVRTRPTAQVAGVAAVASLLLARVVPVGLAVLAGGGLACLVGAWRTRGSAQR